MFWNTSVHHTHSCIRLTEPHSYSEHHDSSYIVVVTAVVVGDVVVSDVVVVLAFVFINVVVVILVLLLLLLSLAQRMLLRRLHFNSRIDEREIEQLRQSAQHQVYADKV